MSLNLWKNSLFIAALQLSCTKQGASAERDIRTVRVQAVTKSVDTSGQRYAATVLPSARFDVAFRLGGYIDRVAQVKGADGRMRNVQEGDWVKKGTVLARLRQSDVEQKLAEARALRNEALGAREQAALDHKRTAMLLTSSSASASEGDAARIQLDVATARVAAAEAKLMEAQTAVEDSVVKAPIDGVVLMRGIEHGTLVAPGTPAFQIADMSFVKVVFGVPDVVLTRLSVGASQAVATEAFGSRSFAGKITRIAPYADQKSRVFEVEVSIPNDDHALRVGMVASLALPKQPEVASVLLPLEAILRSPKTPGGYAVLVVDAAAGAPVAHLREVDLGDFIGNMIPVRGGVAASDRVIVSGASYVADGETVRILPETVDGGGAL